MPYSSLADFLEQLAKRGELTRIAAEVDCALEIAEVTRRVARDGGPALLFERVRGHSLSVATNILGTPERICAALDIESLDDVYGRIEALIQKHTPQNWFDRLKTSEDEAGINKFRSRTVKSGLCQQVVRLGRDVDLTTLPLVSEWPGEDGPSLTAGTLVTQDAASGQRGVTLCPLQCVDPNRLVVIADDAGDFSQHWASYRRAGEKMPAMLVLGGDPAMRVAAGLERPEGVDAFQLTGLLRGKALDVVKARTLALEVPADAEMVLEGYCDPQGETATVQSVTGGGFYRTCRNLPIFHVAAITHRTRPIFPATVAVDQHGELASLVKVRERMLLPMLRGLVSDIVDLRLPGWGGEHRFALVSIRKRFAFQARQVASALWGCDALRFTKFLILVDAEVNLADVPAVLSEVGANVAVERDLFWYDGPALAADQRMASQGTWSQGLGSPGTGSLALGRHLAIDATAKTAAEQPEGQQARVNASAEIERLVSARWGEYQLELAGLAK